MRVNAVIEDGATWELAKFLGQPRATRKRVTQLPRSRGKGQPLIRPHVARSINATRFQGFRRFFTHRTSDYLKRSIAGDRTGK